jgi:hypothetical protein|mmetsp:Transcript_7003/g.9720  ORF Transcript_7003/g.9720 Transcript_7003/m.9720 type:complete len:326 (+) Transcript_7003:1996-2973(+)
MIEQNYFKSSKDTGLKSKLKSGKGLTFKSQSSRDSLSPKKERRRRRRHGDGSKTSLVAKNMVDDVIDADSLANSGEHYDQSRDFKQKLRDAETAHKLHQIAEQEGEESDDGFGPPAPKDAYQLVSNRSTNRGGLTTNATGTNLVADSRMPLENDDFFSPIQEEPEALAVDTNSSVSAKKKSRKKKKKKKAALLAAIGEDLLDSPVQSEGNDSPRANSASDKPRSAGSGEAMVAEDGASAKPASAVGAAKGAEGFDAYGDDDDVKAESNKEEPVKEQAPGDDDGFFDNSPEDANKDAGAAVEDQPPAGEELLDNNNGSDADDGGFF